MLFPVVKPSDEVVPTDCIVCLPIVTLLEFCHVFEREFERYRVPGC